MHNGEGIYCTEIQNEKSFDLFYERIPCKQILVEIIFSRQFVNFLFTTYADLRHCDLASNK